MKQAVDEALINVQLDASRKKFVKKLSGGGEATDNSKHFNSGTEFKICHIG